MSLLLALALPISSAASGESTCRDLFDGESLAGWTLLGEADVAVKDGAIVGTSVATEANTFLRTDERFGDFDLSLGFRYDAGMFNSGVQFRSDVYAETTAIRVRARDGELHDWTADAGRMFGYQADIDPSDRAWTGEIYDEAARGWLETFDKTPVLHAVTPDRWHALRIRALGDHIQTWVDGQPVVDLRDDERSEGFIALQVHGVYEEEQVGKAIAFRDIKLCQP